MRTKPMTGICVALIAMVIGSPSVWAAKKKAAPETPLTEAGQKLQERYAGMLTELANRLRKKGGGLYFVGIKKEASIIVL